jgi:L-glutamine-phosphate cytidylyltransferase
MVRVTSDVRERVIIIGAGRGRRLMPLTAEEHKSFAPIGERRILDWIREALRAGGFEDRDVTFVAGYLAERIEAEYPQFRYVPNHDWENNNILASLMCAEAEMDEGFVSSYADIVYRPEAVRRLMAVAGWAPITLVVDTDWRSRYRERSQHPESDAEKVRVENGRVIELSRAIPSEEAYGEFIGVAHFTAEGAAALRSVYREVLAAYAGRPWRSAAVFEKAYFLDMLQELVDRGIPIGHVDTFGGYFEIDTTEDFMLANRDWGADEGRTTKDGSSSSSAFVVRPSSTVHRP